MKVGHAIIIVAPSGTGKSTLVRHIKSQFQVLKESVSYTTRNPRPGEVDGLNYHFVNEEKFQELKEKNEFIEWAKVHGNFYGTSASFIKAQIDSGEVILLELDVQGADNLKTILKEKVTVIFIEPPSLEILHGRLRSRGTENTGTINIRIKNAEAELERKNDFDYLVKNEILSKAQDQLCGIIEKILSRT